jgi:hypothetical protein
MVNEDLIANTKIDLKKLVFELAWNEGFGCYTRNGFEKMIWPGIADKARWIIYFDIDNMHGLNAAAGSYEPVDAMIREILGIVRSTDYAVGQWKSGDEFLICVTDDGGRENSDPTGLVYRLIGAMKIHGITATFATVPVLSMALSANVNPAVERVYELKKRKEVFKPDSSRLGRGDLPRAPGPNGCRQ